MVDLLLILLTLLLSAFFSGSEIAFVTANRLRVEVQARRGGVVGPIVQRFVKDPALLLTTTLVGNNLALVTYSTLLAIFLNDPLAHFLTDRLGLGPSAVDILVLTIQTIVGSVVVLFIGEIIPKSALRELANGAVFALAIPLRVSYWLLFPLIKIAGWAAALIIRFARGDAETFQQFMRRDFELMIEESKRSGELDLDEDESELLANVFAMGSIRVKESMVPRTDVVAVEVSMTIDDLRNAFVESGHSKLPIYKENIDHIVGVAFAYDLFDEPATIAQGMREARFVPETKLSKDLLREFLESNTSIAIVIDEYGGTAGIVTAEDLLEELFGDIQDEFDQEDEVFRQIDGSTIVMSGRLDVDELEERSGWTLPEGDFETIAGYVLERVGTIPKARDEFELDGFRITVLQATSNRIDLVRMRLIEEQAPPTGSA